MAMRVGVRVGVAVAVGLAVDDEVAVTLTVGVADEVGVAVGDEVAVAVGDGVGVGVPGERRSRAPISQATSGAGLPFTGRAYPRWSTVRLIPFPSGQPRGLPGSTAGLLADGAWVRVEPPLSARGPSFG